MILEVTNEQIRRFQALHQGGKFHGIAHLDEMTTSPEGKLKPRCESRSGSPSDDLVRRHLEGDSNISVGYAPLRPDGTVLWCCIDDDDPVRVRRDIAANIQKLASADVGIPIVPTWSKSGGMHYRIYFSSPVPAEQAVAWLRTTASLLGLPSNIEVFPKGIDPNVGTQPGNWVNAPYHGLTRLALRADSTTMGLDKFLDFAEASQMSPGEASSIFSRLSAPSARANTAESTSRKPKPELLAGSRHNAIVYRIAQQAGDPDMTEGALFQLIDDWMKACAYDEEDGRDFKKFAKQQLAKRDAAPKMEKFSNDDVGNAQRFVALHGDIVRYNHERARQVPWLIWDTKCWAYERIQQAKALATEVTVRMLRRADELEAAQDKESEKIGKALRRHAKSTRSNGSLEAMLKMAGSIPDINVLPEQLDSDDWVLNVENGTIDLRTGELRPHNQSDLITRSCPVRYDPNALPSPVFESLLDQITLTDKSKCQTSATIDELEQEYRTALQCALGYCLTGDTSEKIAFFGYGPKHSGKSTFLRAVSLMFGDYAVNIDFNTILTRPKAQGDAPRSDLLRLDGPRFAYCSEVERDQKFDERTIKMLTGFVDPITVRGLYTAPRTFLPKLKLMMAANDRPKIDDDAEASWSRIYMLPFSHTLPDAEQDHDLPQKLALPENLTAMLTWAVQGCLLWQKTRPLKQPTVARESKSEYRMAMHPLKSFVDECLTFDPKATILARDMYARYKAWADEAEIHGVLTNSEFGSKFREFHQKCFDKPLRTATSGRQNIMTYLGVRVKTDLEMYGSATSPAWQPTLFDGEKPSSATPPDALPEPPSTPPPTDADAPPPKSNPAPFNWISLEEQAAFLQGAY